MLCLTTPRDTAQTTTTSIDRGVRDLHCIDRHVIISWLDPTSRKPALHQIRWTPRFPLGCHCPTPSGRSCAPGLRPPRALYAAASEASDPLQPPRSSKALPP